MAGNRVRDNPTPVVRDSHGDQAAHLEYMCRGAKFSPLVDDSFSVSPHGPRLVDATGLLVVSLTSLAHV